jgi:hypothetical protein
MVPEVGTVVEVVDVEEVEVEVVVVLLGVVEVEPPHAASNAIAEITMIESFFILIVLCSDISDIPRTCFVD